VAVEYKSVKKSFREHIDFNFRIYRNIKTYFKKMLEFLRSLKTFEIGLNNRENRFIKENTPEEGIFKKTEDYIS